MRRALALRGDFDESRSHHDRQPVVGPITSTPSLHPSRRKLSSIEALASLLQLHLSSSISCVNRPRDAHLLVPLPATPQLKSAHLPKSARQVTRNPDGVSLIVGAGVEDSDERGASSVGSTRALGEPLPQLIWPPVLITTELHKVDHRRRAPQARTPIPARC